MRRPSPELSADERKLLVCLAALDYVTPKHSASEPYVLKECGFSKRDLDQVLWDFLDERRFVEQLAYRNVHFIPPLVMLTPTGLDVANGEKPPVEPLLLAAIASGQEPEADPNAVDQPLFS